MKTNTNGWNTKNYSKRHSENVVCRGACACTCVTNRQVRLPFYQKHKLQSSQKKTNFRITHPHVQCLSLSLSLSGSHRSLLLSSCTLVFRIHSHSFRIEWLTLCLMHFNCFMPMKCSLTLVFNATQLTYRMHQIFGPYFSMRKCSLIIFVVKTESTETKSVATRCKC